MRYLKIILALTCISILSTSYKPANRTKPGDDYPVYTGNDLGVSWSSEKTVFKVWAPTATAMKLRLYAAGEGGKPLQTFNLTKAQQGVWELTVNQDLKNQYYAFQTRLNGRWL